MYNPKDLPTTTSWVQRLLRATLFDVVTNLFASIQLAETAMKIVRVLGFLIATVLAVSAQAQGVNLQSLTETQRAALQMQGTGPALQPTAPAIPKSQPVKVENAPMRGAFASLPLRPFGENVFQGDGSRYVTPSDMPVPSDYVIGVGDVVEVRLFGKENKILQLRVERNGVITLPEIGPVTVLGMSFEAMSSMVLERIAKQKIGVEATVSMGALRSIQVFLSGDVGQPGAYTVDGLTTLPHVLLVGGGVRPTGSLRRVEIQRHGRVVAKVDLYDYLLKGRGKADVRLQSGDTVFVPPVGRQVAVGGDVLKPAIYELLNEKSAEETLNLAGGMLPSAFPAKTKLDRLLKNGSRETFWLPTQEKRALQVMDGDSILVPSALGRADRGVTLVGHVPNAGASIQWKEGLHVAQLLGSAQDLLADYFRLVGVIERTEETTGAKSFLAFNLHEVLSKGKVVPLMPEDKVIVLKQEDVEFLSSVSVQNVLFGKLPTPQGGALVNSGRDKLVFGAQANQASRVTKSAIDSAANTNESSKAELQPLESAMFTMDQGYPRADQVVARTEHRFCNGLLYLADIVGQEGAFRFRGAVAASAAEGEGVKLSRNQACTKIYDQFPGLLAFLLENVAVVRGEVLNPGLVPVAPSVTVEMAISARGGVTRSADAKGVELTTFIQETGRTERKVLGESLKQKTELDPGAAILVRKRATDQDAGLVKLGGEVLYPGTYSIRKGERLSELMARAGGLTQFAYAYGAVFQRAAIKDEKKVYYAKAAQELQQSVLFGLTRQRAAASAQDGLAGASGFVMSVMNDLKNMSPTGRMVVEADPTVLQVRPEQDVMLQPGDEIYIPRRPSHVNVMGEVLNPGAVQFQSGKLASDYVKAVGGTTRLADLDRVYVILPNGAAEPLKLSSWNFSPTLVPPGSTIYVTREALPTTPTDLMLIVTQMAKDIALTAASLVVIGK